MPTEITDPALLAQLEGPGGEVTDPALLAQLEGKQAPVPAASPQDKALGPWASAAVRPIAKGVAALPLMAMDAGVAARNLTEQGVRKFAPGLARTIDKVTGGGPGQPYQLPSDMFNESLDAVTTTPEGVGKGAEFVSSVLAGARTGAPTAAAQAPANFVAQGPRTAAQEFADRGIPLTIGRRAGGVAQTAEDLASNFPIVGGAIRARQQEALEAWNRSLLQQIDRSVTAGGREGFEQASTALRGAYRQIWADEMPFNRGGLRDAWTALSADVGRRLPREQADEVLETLRHQFGQIRSGARQGGTQGAALESVDDALRDAAKKAAKAGDGAVATAYNAARTAFRDQMDPTANAALQRTDELYMQLSTLRNAAKRSGWETFTPAQLLMASKRKASDAAVAEMRAPFQQEALQAADVLGVPRSNPQAALERGVNTALGRTMGALAVGGGAMLDLGTTAAATGLGRALYSRAGQRLLTEGPSAPTQREMARVLAQSLAQMETN